MQVLAKNMLALPVTCNRCPTMFVLQLGDEALIKTIPDRYEPSYHDGRGGSERRAGWQEAACPECGKMNKITLVKAA